MKHSLELSKTLPLRYHDVADVLRALSARTLRDAGKSRVKHEHRLATTLEVSVTKGTRVRRRVGVDIGVYTETASQARLPLKIAAETHPRLFPTMEADVVARPATRGTGTDVSLAGFVREPLGPVGAVGGAAVRHHLADDSVAAFFDDLLARIGLEAREARPSWVPPLVPTSLHR